MLYTLLEFIRTLHSCISIDTYKVKKMWEGREIRVEGKMKERGLKRSTPVHLYI